jgi:hypothetical protein
VVPESDVLDGGGVALQGSGVQRLVGGELTLDDAVEPIGLSGHADVVDDVRPLGLELVGHDAESLQHVGVDAEPEHPYRDQRRQGHRDQTQSGPGELGQAGDGGHQGQHRQHPEGRERGVDIRVGGAVDDAARRIDQIEAVQPEAHADEREQERPQHEQMRPRAGG